MKKTMYGHPAAGRRMMVARVLTTLAMFMMVGTTMMADSKYTRGIGQYPGRTADYKGPEMVKDDAYRNVALDRAAYASSSFDYNLTAQLATDGIVTAGEPARLTVSTPDGVLSLRDKEKTIDGNVHSSNYLMGEQSYIRFDWTGMQVQVDRIDLLAEVAYHADAATGGYAIRVLASDDGQHWQEVGTLTGRDLPGEATKQMVSSDPNKREATVRLPLRRVKTSIPLSKPGRYSHLRLEFNMKGGAWWRLYELNEGWMPSAHFASAFAVAPTTADPTPWIYVDLGTEVVIDHVRLHWVHKARRGEIQFSDDARQWRTVGTLPGGTSTDEVVDCRGKARYVRLTMSQPDASGLFVLSELEVWGRGGLVPRVTEGGEISLWQLRRDGDSRWIPATVPGTVLTSYMNIGAVPDNRYANNMRQISESFFMSDFWYRAHLQAPQAQVGQHTYLHFDGINWKAEVYLNGQPVGHIDGAFIRGRFDITQLVHAGDNLLEVKVIRNAHFGAVKEKNAESTDLNGGISGADNPTFHASIGWDWITSTPGREVGIWNDVYLSHDQGISLNDPVVTTVLSHPDTLATLTPAVMVRNAEAQTRRVEVKGWIGDIVFVKQVDLQPSSTLEVSFSPADFPQLQRRSMRLWWPNGYGEPYLYDAGFQVRDVATGQRSSSLTYKAGIREMSYRDLDSETKLYVNGKRFTPLGGNWGFSETNLNYRSREYDAAVRYHREMNYNMIRNWVGQIGDRAFYEACDKYGIMVWQDFWLANPWDGPDPYDNAMFLANSHDYILRIRRHPSLALYVGRNEGFPPEALDTVLRRQVSELHPQLGYIPSSADNGVSGHGAYQLMPIDYYFTQQSGKLHSERGMPNVPSYESLRRMLAPGDLWPIGLAWGQHDFTQHGAQGGASFVETLTNRFGTPVDARQFASWAQWLNYDGYRAMYEASQQQRMGLLIWMSHACWPSMVWQTYDYYLEPTAAYFGVKKACEPLHVQYNPVRKAVEVVNLATGRHERLTVRARAFSLRGKLLHDWTAVADIDDDQTLSPLSIDLPATEACLLRLSLEAAGAVVSENTYVESVAPEGWKALAQLPRATVKQQGGFAAAGDEQVCRITLTNTSDTPALMVRLNLRGADGEQILPVIYSDNYFHLLPGEQKTVEVSFRTEDGRGVTPHIAVEGFNL